MQPVLLRAAGYTRAAAQVERGRRYVAGGAAAGVAAAGLAGSSLRRVTKKKAMKRKSGALDTPQYLPGGSAVGFQTQYVQTDPYDVTVVDGAGYCQLTQLPRETVGSKLTRQELLNRHTESNMFHRIDRFQDQKPASAENGAYWLSYTRDSITPTVYYLPLYTFDLTSLNENTGVDNTGAVDTWRCAPMLRLRRSVSAATGNPYTFLRQDGKKNDGTTSSVLWNSESYPYSTTANNTPYQKSLLRWADIRLQVWGAKANPSSIEISLVRFKDENIGPPSFETNDDGSTWQTTHPTPTYVAPTVAQYPSDDFAQYQKFWTTQVDSVIGAPNAMRLRKTDSDGLQVIYRKVIKLNPTANFETDTTGHQYSIKINYLMDMIGDFNHYTATNVGGDNVTTDMADPNVWPVDVRLTQNRSVLKNKNSRVFLMIRGLATTTVTDASGAGTVNDTASFDLMVRRCITII